MHECVRLVFTVSELMFTCICTKHEDLHPDARADIVMKCDIFTIFII